MTVHLLYRRQEPQYIIVIRVPIWRMLHQILQQYHILWQPLYRFNHKTIHSQPPVLRVIFLPIQKLLELQISLREMGDDLHGGLVVLDILEVELEVGHHLEHLLIEHGEVVVEPLELVVELYVKLLIHLLYLLDVPEDLSLDGGVDEFELLHGELVVADDEGDVVEVSLLGFD